MSYSNVCITILDLLDTDFYLSSIYDATLSI